MKQEFQRNVNSEDNSLGFCGNCCIVLSTILIIFTFPFSLCYIIKIVQEYERVVIFRLGRVITGGARGPGLFIVFPCIDEFVKIDLRMVSVNIPPQEILTKDSVTVAVDAVIFTRIFDPVMATCNVANARYSTSLLAATTLRNVLGTKNMAELLSDRDTIADHMQQILDESTDPWGVQIERVEIKDVRLPIQLQRAMAAEAEASREALAKVIAAEGEQRASVALKDAAEIMMQSPTAMQLRYMQTLGTVAAERESTIIFPLPMETMFSLDKVAHQIKHSPLPVQNQAFDNTGVAFDNTEDVSHSTEGVPVRKQAFENTGVAFDNTEGVSHSTEGVSHSTEGVSHSPEGVSANIEIASNNADVLSDNLEVVSIHTEVTTL
ncbi:erythrocyte band 7 integral membrane protein [Mytilus galloprovincialis]|uniref:Erythrocyte band 7 integral membrane protein n=1 Tax=Mytilus galloprovincialis TaxID=29158 RepID=A0A8B6CW26_MYTGA|nr:erythrocyte band 7 integral membrane protein [Mytilus galloprovincialis]VDI47681.1 erythrocyte band 7 integral membrane protein [Mytilus galloprovincialis]